MNEYRNITFLISLNLLLVNACVFIWRLILLDVFGCLMVAMLGGALYVLMRLAVLTLKLEEDLREERLATEKTEDGKKE